MGQISWEVLRCDVKDENENLYVLENMISLRLKILLHKHVLTTTVPQWKNEIA